MKDKDLKYLLKDFFYLITLKLDNNQITKVTEMFAQFHYLTHLSIAYNNILEVTDEFLKSLKTSVLEVIDFRNNKSGDIMYTAPMKGSFDEFIKQVKQTEIQPPDAAEFIMGTTQYLWDSGELSDFVIKVGSASFNVHKSILAANSEVFRGMFRHAMKENTNNVMTISDCSENTAKAFLMFLYTAKLPSVINPIEVFAMAAKYNVQKLKLYCEELICKQMNNDNVVDALKMGNLHNSEKIKRASFAYIQKMLPGITIDEGLINQPGKVTSIVNAMKAAENAVKIANKSAKKSK